MMKATVKVLTLPIVEGVNGPDDLLASHGDDALQKVFDAPPESAIESPAFSEIWLACDLSLLTVPTCATPRVRVAGVSGPAKFGGKT